MDLHEEVHGQQEIPGDGAEDRYPFQKRALLPAQQQADPKQEAEGHRQET